MDKGLEELSKTLMKKDFRKMLETGNDLTPEDFKEIWQQLEEKRKKELKAIEQISKDNDTKVFMLRTLYKPKKKQNKI